jgi:hypothetical protein
VPYRGQKRWHTILGLVFGIATITWAFSGSLAFLPFPQDRPAQNARARTQAPSANAEADPSVRNDDSDNSRPGRGAGSAAAGQRRPGEQSDRAEGSGRQRNERGRRGGGGAVASALRGRVKWNDFRDIDPREFLTRHADLKVKEMTFTSFDGAPYYSARLANGKSQLFALDGLPVEGFDTARVIDIVRESAPNPEAVETRIVEQYDVYYLDRTRRRPLPVILALMHDAEETRYYIDPKTATVVGNYRSSNWTRRWLYQGLHSLNFPFLYNYRPLWDIVVIGFMLGGTALSITSLVLAWRTAHKRLRLKLRPKKALAPRPAREPANAHAGGASMRRASE